MSENYLDGAQLGRLRQALPMVVSTSQRELDEYEDEDEDDRYAALGA